MTKGFTLLALGNKKYGYWARNMAASIKHFTPDAKIQLIHDGQATAGIPIPDHYGSIPLYDDIAVMDAKHYTLDGRFAPGYAKTNLDLYFTYDHTIYLDVDGVCICDVGDLHDKCSSNPFGSHVWGSGKLEDKTFGNAMYWADAPEIWEHWRLSDDAVLPFVNTSFLSSTPHKTARTVWREVHKAIENPLPLNKMRELWGKGNQPDELYFNVGFAKAQHDPLIKGLQHPIYFRPYTVYGKPDKLPKLQEQYYFIGLWGGQRFNHKSLYEHYDRVMREVWAAVGVTHAHKTQQLMRAKFVETH